MRNELTEDEALYLDLCILFPASEIVKLKIFQKRQLISLLRTENLDACEAYFEKCLSENKKEGNNA